MSTPFQTIFKLYRPEESCAEAVSCILVDRLTGDRQSRAITVHGASRQQIAPEALSRIESAVRALYGLEQFSISLTEPHPVFSLECLPGLFADLKAEFPATNGFLNNAVSEVDPAQHTLAIHLKGEGADFLTHAGCNHRLEEMLRERFEENLTVSFIGGSTEASAFDKEAVLDQVMKEAAASAPPPLPKKAAPVPAAVTEENGLIFGKPAKYPHMPIGELNLDYGAVTITGDVFSVAHKNITTKARENFPSRELGIVTFDITDYTGSIRVSRSMDVPKAQPVQDAIRAGDTLTVQGKLTYNNFEKEMILNPTCILRAQKEERRDTAEHKRVELHLHTNMSMMDGMSSPTALIAQAAKWGHSAVAITDHGVAQAFPEAMNAAKKYGIKVVYGVEAYYVNDSGGAVDGLQRRALSDEIVVFDLETTGFKPATESIIEIGAVKLKDGEIIDRFSEFVNPGREIPANITELTGISDAMVADAEPIEVILPRFIEFIGDCPLGAHNASFDVGFINYYCAKLGIEREFTSIDTLVLARAFLPNERHHRLDDVAHALDLGDFNHHRACDDAEVTGRIMLKFFAQLSQMGVGDIQGINDAIRDMNSGGRVHSNHLIILVKNYTGLKNLYILISESHLHYYRKRPIIPRSLLDRYREGLILGSACEAGELFRAIVAKKPWNELRRIADYYDYLEVQPIGNNMFMLRDGSARDEQELREFNETIVKLGQSLSKPVVATGDVHFLNPQDEVFRRILMAGQGFTDADNQAPLYFKPTQEMLEEFSYLGQQKAYEIVVENPNRIAESCEVIRPVPEGTYPPSIEGSAEDLQRICYTKAKELYGDPLPQPIAERIEAELKPIINNGFDVMYMTAQKLIKKSNDAGYLVGSRGSVGSSVVAYFCGISEVNPLPPHYICDNCKNLIIDHSEKYGCGADMPDQVCPNCGHKFRKDGFNIPFFTFLGFNAEKEPDIDLNFAGEYQTQAHRDCVELFGDGQVFKAGTIGTIADKTAYGYVRKYAEERGLTLSKAEINRLTIGCTGVKRTTGQHPGGLIIVPRDRSIYEFCPIQHPADDPNSTIITTHFDFHAIHDNLLKLDMLGHDNPTIIKHLEDMTGVKATDIPLDDPETIGIFTDLKYLGIDHDELLGLTGAVAVPEFGTRFARQMLLDTKPRNFDGLVRISGLSHGTDVWMGNAADLIKNGTATLNDVIASRDDITMFLISKGIDASLSFKTSEAIRKGKGIIPETIEIMKEHGVPQWYIDSCLKIKYLYPKAHAVAYVMMAFRIAWFKVHYPLPFYSSYFSIRAVGFDAGTMTHGIESVKKMYNDLNSKPDATANEKDTVVTLEVVYEFYRRGFSFQQVDIYRSDASTFLIDGNSLIPPLTALPGLGLTAAQDIVRERELGPFSSTEDLSLRCQKVSKAVIDILEKNGALSSLPKSDQISMFDL